MCREMKCKEVILNSGHLLLSRQLLVCKQFAEIIVPKVATQGTDLISLTVLWRGFPGGTVVKNPPAKAGDVGLIPELGRSPGEGNGNPLQYSCLGKSLVGYNPWGGKESDTTELLHFHNRT